MDVCMVFVFSEIFLKFKNYTIAIIVIYISVKWKIPTARVAEVQIWFDFYLFVVLVQTWNSTELNISWDWLKLPDSSCIFIIHEYRSLVTFSIMSHPTNPPSPPPHVSRSYTFCWSSHKYGGKLMKYCTATFKGATRGSTALWSRSVLKKYIPEHISDISYAYAWWTEDCERDDRKQCDWGSNWIYG